ncbi:MAG: hypothetical protein IH617_05715, partial [Hydrogenophaga sp.]|nr:hypothetical protein [Hydrogenophaga sp.]
MLFDGAALAEGVVMADSAEPQPPIEAPVDNPDTLAAEALLAEEPSDNDGPDVATTQQNEEDADAAMLAQTQDGDEAVDTTDTASDEVSGVADEEGVDADEAEAMAASDEADAKGEAEEDVDGEAAIAPYNELVVVDSRVNNHENLLVDMPSNVTVIVVGADEDGLAA